MSDLPTLYIRDSDNRTRIWSVWTEGDTRFTEHGLAGGKLTLAKKKATPKNVGRSNETTAGQQAELEAQSAWTYQVEREDYHQDIEQSGLEFRPMLAQDYLKVPHLVDWSRVVVQPKLDGLRLSYGYRTARSVDEEFMSRKGINYKLEHLYAGATALFAEVNCRLEHHHLHICQDLDGETYRHGWACQTILSKARKVQDDTKELDYVLFDLAISLMSFKNRYELLEDSLNEVAPQHSQLKLVRNFPCKNEEELKFLQDKFLKCGFEGAMIRHLDSLYAPATRSADLFKFKLFDDQECEIIGVEIDANDNAVLICVTAADIEFKCTPKRTHDERKAMLKDMELIGSYIKVKHQGVSLDGVPIFPVGLEIRPCNDLGEPLV